MATKDKKRVKEETPIYTYNKIDFANHVEFSAYLLSRKVFEAMDSVAVLTAIKNYVAHSYPHSEALQITISGKMVAFINDKKNILIASFMKL